MTTTITLHVDVAGNPQGDGSKDKPFWRITDALAEARLKTEKDTEIVIDVASGTYTGSYDAVALANNPHLEVLPLILDVNNLTLRGKTEFQMEKGVPTDYLTGGQTLITGDKQIADKQTIILIAHTQKNANRDGIGVTVEGLVLESPEEGTVKQAGVGLLADRVRDFIIRNNAISNFMVGLRTRYASGRLSGNVLKGNVKFGAGIIAGSVNQPSNVALHGNYATENLFGICLSGTGGFFQQDIGQNNIPFQQVPNPLKLTLPQDQKDVPDQLTVELTRNDLSGNKVGGFRCFFYSPQTYETNEFAKPLTSNVTVKAEANSFKGNTRYGIVLDAGFPFSNNPRQFSSNFTGRFDNNQVDNNVTKAALFTFERVFVLLNLPDDKPASTYKYLSGSNWVVTGSDAEFQINNHIPEDSDYDNPDLDPLSQRKLGNTLIINKQELTGSTL